jgi:hypothetical protein
MAARAGVGSRNARNRLTATWLIIFGALLLAFAGTVVTLNSTLYSASGFVSSYLDALARHDVPGALAMPGVEHPDAAETTLLTPDALGEIDGYSLVSDDSYGTVHVLRFEVRFEQGASAEVEFSVEHTGARLGVFSGWSFTRSPIGVLEATPLHAADFEVNGVPVRAENPGQPTRLQVLTPGVYTLSHDSTYLVGEPTSVLAADSQQVTPAELDIQASQAFVDQVNLELAEYLDDCTTQQVLQPTDCPFGQRINDRIDSLPQWSISHYPEVTIEPGGEPGTWVVPETIAAAHLVVQVRSLFDGSVSTFDEDVPFTVSYTITFPGDGGLLITPR